MDSAPSRLVSSLDPRLAARIEHECDACIETLWKRTSGLAMRFSPQASGVVERPGRTRFDVRVGGSDFSVSGPLRASARELPVLDQSLGLVVLDRVGELGATAFGAILDEAVRTLTEDGHLIVTDINPWGWIGLNARRCGQACGVGALRSAHLLRAAGLEEVSIEHRLWWPPLPAAILDRWSGSFDALGSRLWPGLGSLYVVSGRKRGSSVISIPLGRREQRAGVMAAAGSMRRAG